MYDQKPIAMSALQALINKLSTTTKIADDGVYGEATHRAFLSLSPQDQSKVRTFANVSLGYTIPKNLSWGQVQFLVDKASKATGVPVSYLMKLVKLENTTTPTGIQVEYEGTFRGIGQFDKATWQRVSSLDFSKVVNDEDSLLAVCQLYIDNKATFAKKYPGKPFTDEVAYLYHNQGAGNAYDFLATGDAKPVLLSQSKAAVAVAYTARDQVMAA
jgi:hypothetical protein